MSYEYEAGTLNQIWDEFELKEEADHVRLTHKPTGAEFRFKNDGALAGAEKGHFDLQPEGIVAGNAADVTGVQYTSEMTALVEDGLASAANNVYLEAATNSSAGDEEVTVEVYDVDAGAVVASVAITGGGRRVRSADLSDSLTQGNELEVRYNVTTASATSGATFDAVNARLVAE